MNLEKYSAGLSLQLEHENIFQRDRRVVVLKEDLRTLVDALEYIARTEWPVNLFGKSPQQIARDAIAEVRIKHG